jgi:hypothetical protein
MVKPDGVKVKPVFTALRVKLAPNGTPVKV